jgi:hypothetical protein
MAPEVYQCAGYSEKVDVYAWALLTAEMLTLTRPYNSYRSVTILESSRSSSFSDDLVWILCLLGSMDDFYTKVVCGHQRPQIDSSPSAPLRSLIRRSWDTDPELRPSMSLVLSHLAFINAEIQKHSQPVNRNFFGDVDGESVTSSHDEELALRLHSECGLPRSAIIRQRLHSLPSIVKRQVSEPDLKGQNIPVTQIPSFILRTNPLFRIVRLRWAQLQLVKTSDACIAKCDVPQKIAPKSNQGKRRPQHSVELWQECVTDRMTPMSHVLLTVALFEFKTNVPPAVLAFCLLLYLSAVVLAFVKVRLSM